eukprot:scaffold4850_cov340-Prasinococcus_capsulatus_cf.AAC.1
MHQERLHIVRDVDAQVARALQTVGPAARHAWSRSGFRDRCRSPPSSPRRPARAPHRGRATRPPLSSRRRRTSPRTARTAPACRPPARCNRWRPPHRQLEGLAPRRPWLPPPARRRRAPHPCPPSPPAGAASEHGSGPSRPSNSSSTRYIRRGEHAERRTLSHCSSPRNQCREEGRGAEREPPLARRANTTS